MGHRAWIAVAVGLAGLCAPAAGQPAARPDLPDPSDYFLPPVSNPADRSRPSDDRPRRSLPPADDRGDDEVPPPRPPSGKRLQPIPPVSRDDDPPPTSRTRRPAPQYSDDDPPPVRKRRPAPPSDDYDDPPRPTRRPAPPADDRGDDEIPPPRPPKRTSPPPAAKLAGPSGIRPVSAEEVENARSSADAGRQDRPPQVNIIDYLASDRDRNAPPGRPASESAPHEAGLFGKTVSDVFEPITPTGREPLQSDHCFDTFVSPVTNPFLFEDPRSVTELRPIFMYQRIPSPVPLYEGGNLTFVGLQARLAINDRLSFVLHKFGGQGVNPTANYPYGDNFGLAELWLGPKFTLIRDTDAGRLLAGGLQFQIPIGSSKVFQNTGTLSIVPYATFAQNFLSTNSGSFNGLVGTGYAFSTNSERSNYYYLSGHLDYDVGNHHRFYPLAELNWFYYTTNGSSSFLPFEGRDLINFGSRSNKSNLMTWALGARGKLTPSTELGGAFEGPLFGNRDLFRYRFTVDFIWRY